MTPLRNSLKHIADIVVVCVTYNWDGEGRDIGVAGEAAEHEDVLPSARTGAAGHLLVEATLTTASS